MIHSVYELTRSCRSDLANEKRPRFTRVLHNYKKGTIYSVLHECMKEERSPGTLGLGTIINN